ncbi:uncharacterized protein EDB91DRAFT_1254544 [Suillus paluster]|uniref:uncharacterized protein n=1 Tax=Suillus paluster TaxID=48578 RepID=UPI001B86A7C1|nr:uncharacterized protein EDB91DRAFT_1254544 [Suillus paluster]KAG1726031.1 hypothetical protein EDB91DRAFT_1254544 [Suillus paluster]
MSPLIIQECHQEKLGDGEQKAPYTGKDDLRYTSDALIDVSKELLQCDEHELQMELFNLLINPLEHDFALRWDRDDVRENATAEEEVAALGLWTHGASTSAKTLLDQLT